MHDSARCSSCGTTNRPLHVVVDENHDGQPTDFETCLTCVMQLMFDVERDGNTLRIVEVEHKDARLALVAP